MNPFFWALLCSLTWGLVPLIEKFGLLKLSPMVGLFYRCLGVIIGLVFLFLWENRAIRESVNHLHPGMLYLAVGGLLASVVGQIFFYLALKDGEASMVVPIAASYPLVTFILGVLILGEKITWAKVAGMAFVVLGIFFLK